MGTLLSYSIISGLMMLTMYLVYRLLMARDNQPGFNRGALLLIYAVSFAVSPAFMSMKQGTDSSAQMPAIDMAGVAMAGEPLSRPMWGTVMIWIFASGMAIMAVRTIITWARLTYVIRRGERIRHAGYTLVVTDDERFAPFSWMRYVVISRKDYYNNCQTIVTHELRHVCSLHWIDLLVAQAVCIINWFNPAAWLMRDELMLVHEYQADRAVIDSGHNTKEYQMLLIEKAVGSRFPSLANSLNHSKLKKRITMMYKEKSGAGHKLRALALVPALALAFGVTSLPAVGSVMSVISSSEISVSKSSENLSQDKATVKIFKVIGINNYNNQTTLTIKGYNVGDVLTVSGGTFTTDGKTYKAKSMSCEMTDGEATIKVIFPFTSVYDNTSMTLIINGEETPFDLSNFFRGNATILVPDDKEIPTTAKMKIYLDDKEISDYEMSNLDPGMIESITVDKQNNAVMITTKK